MSSTLNINTISSVSSYTTAFEPIVATGGTISNVTINNVSFRIHTFTSNGVFQTRTIGSNARVDYLVVAGGGGGGMDMGGGGGGGGVLSGTLDLFGQTAYGITVGNGGWGAPGGSQFRGDGVGPQPGAHQFTIPSTNGTFSSIFSPERANIVATGGGGGGSSYYPYTPGAFGFDGGSGGGASGYSDGSTRRGGNGISGQGYAGGNGGGQYYGGGGGGAGGPGITSWDTGRNATGGPGIRNDILGNVYYWGGGGGGSAYSYGFGGDGGIGGGGGGAVGVTFGGAGYNNGNAGGGGSPGSQTNTRGGNAGPSTGGGGGGGSHYNATNPGGNGGSGIVIIRYPLVDTSMTVTGTPGTAFASPGSVIQTVYRRTDARFTYASSTSDGTPIGELGLTITPKKANSLLVMKWMINAEFYQDNVFVIWTDNGLISQPEYQGYNNTQNNQVQNGIMSARYDIDENSTMSNWFLFFTAPANDTTTRTYYPAVRGTSTHTFALNRTIGSLGQDGYETAVSAGYIMEIAQ
jgi:hypothetical protein